MIDKVFYYSGVCSEQEYEKWFINAPVKPGQQIQKYHRVMLKGLAKQKEIDVKAISKLPIQPDNCKKLFIKKYFEQWHEISICYLPIFNLPKLNILFQYITGFISVGTLKQKKQSVVILDVLNISLGLGVILACKIRDIKCIGIITDLPEMLVEDEKSFFVRQCKRIINACDGYVLLTDAMNTRVNPNNTKPYEVIEGQADSSMQEIDNMVKDKYNKRVCLYSGSLNRIHGISYLVKGFLKADIENSELHIYGDGDYVNELIEVCKINNKVKYFGVKLNSEIITAQMKATLLVNPRPTDKEFVKYSFPSKNIEYMSSGTPMLTTRLPGMPAEYNEYVYLLDEENEDGMKKKLEEILSQDLNILHEKGLLAKEFIINNKSDYHQAKKIVNLIKRLE